MPMSVRLDRETEARIRRIASEAGKSRSWVVREAVASYAPESSGRSAADVLAPFIGAGGTGRRDLSERTGERLTALLRKRGRRPR